MRVALLEARQVEPGARDQRDPLARGLQLVADDLGESQQPVALLVRGLGRRIAVAQRAGVGRQGDERGAQRRGSARSADQSETGRVCSSRYHSSFSAMKKPLSVLPSANARP